MSYHSVLYKIQNTKYVHSKHILYHTTYCVSRVDLVRILVTR